MSLQLSEKFSLPVEAGTWTFAFLAIKGAGKTYDAAKLAEQMLKNNIPIVVLDPMGIWWGLRVQVPQDMDGSGGFPIVIFGGDHADLPIPTTLSKDKKHQIIDEDKLRQATVAILQAGLSVVFDTSKLSVTQQTRAVTIFSDEMYHKNTGIRHVFIEEADEYCPQEPKGEKNESKNAIDQLVRRGGNRNIGVTMITQRPAVLNKNVLSQTTCLLVLRIQWMKDKDTIRDWIRNAVKDEKEQKSLAKWYDTLKELKNGEAWIYSPEHEIPLTKVQFGERETLHASREYFLTESWEQKNVTLRDVGEFINRFKQKFEPKPKIAVDTQMLSDKPKSPISSPVPQNKPAPLYTPKITPPPSSGNSPEWDPVPDFPLEVKQSVPTINITRLNGKIDVAQPLPFLTFNHAAMFDEPQTMIGKLAVLINNDRKHPLWTENRFRKELAIHQWSEEGLQETMTWLIRWEILKPMGPGKYNADGKRITVT